MGLLDYQPPSLVGVGKEPSLRRVIEAYFYDRIAAWKMDGKPELTAKQFSDHYITKLEEHVYPNGRHTGSDHGSNRSPSEHEGDNGCRTC